MYKAIDLFSGIGGIRLGFESASRKLQIPFKTVFSSEIDKFAIQTYQANFLNSEVYGDITKINPSSIPDHDILFAGFPCQPFSIAGIKKGFDDMRGTLFFNIKEILKIKKPDAFLLENVKGLKNHNKGQTLKVILRELRNIGYTVNYKILCAKDFGLPQNRERIFISGFNKYHDVFNFPKTTNIKTQVADILESQVDLKYTLSDKLWLGHQRRKKAHIKKGNGFGYSLFNKKSEYTNTISARYYKDGSEALIEQKNKNPRRLTPRECARLQGFPDSFLIPVSDTQAYKQFGNSVSVNVIKNIAKEMLIYLQNLSNYQDQLLHTDYLQNQKDASLIL